MSSAKSWFVQTEFGATFGPMPDDALLEMVRTGALLKTDQVRAGREGQWRLASEFPGLFDAVTASPTSTENSPSNNLAEIPSMVPASSPSNPPTIHLIPPTQPAHPDPPLIAMETPATVATSQPQIVTETAADSRDVAPMALPRIEELSANAPPENHLIAAWKSQRSQSKVELGVDSLAAELGQAESGDDLAPELPADLLDDEVVPASTTAANKSPSSRPVANRRAFLDQIAGLEDGPRRPIETSQQKWDRWRRSLPTWPIVLAITLVLFTTWAYWPRSQRGIYDRYVAIWQEWKTRRTDFKDKEGWDQFLKHTQAELDDMVPWLEKHARSSDREKLLLLWIGRDCFQRMLRQPRQMDSPEEKQLQFLLLSMRDFYESPDTVTAGGGIAASMDADPEHPIGAGVFDPNAVRPATKTASPAPPGDSDNSASDLPASR